MNPETSIIIPMYNAEKYIDETISSVFKQEYTNWELIIIDDGSSDSSAQTVQKYLSDTRIKYYYQKNAGVSVARNNGIEKSKGKFIAFLDADDVWKPANLNEKIYTLKTGNAYWVYSDMDLIDQHSKSLDKTVEGTDVNITEHYLLWDRTVVPGPCSNIVIKRLCFEDANIRFDPNFSTAADQDFCFNLSARYTGKRIPKPLWSYRILSQSMSRNIKVMEKDHLAVYRKAQKNNLFKSFIFRKKCYSNLYLILAGSWWKNGNNKPKALYFMFRSVVSFPPQLIKILKKI